MKNANTLHVSEMNILKATEVVDLEFAEAPSMYLNSARLFIFAGFVLTASVPERPQRGV
jgi:hypothetical protein